MPFLCVGNWATVGKEVSESPVNTNSGDPCFHCRRPSQQKARSQKQSPGRISAILFNLKAGLSSATRKSGMWLTD